MKTFFIDCEWNSFGGEFISIALVSPEGDDFYATVGCVDPHPWVAEHVMPVLAAAPITFVELQGYLEKFLSHWERVHIIADWPEDFIHFNRLLITGPGLRMGLPHITMEIDLSLEGESQVPHNAFSDALANMHAFIERKYAP